MDEFINVKTLSSLYRAELTVSKFLISHLAFADLCLGIYLLLIASIDLHSMGEYFNFAYDWQYGAYNNTCNHALNTIEIAKLRIIFLASEYKRAFDTRSGIGCKVAGSLTAFATHLSVFTLTLVTIERWYAITHAIYLNKRLQLKTASCIMLCGWIYSIVMSTLPLFGFSNYSSTR